MQLVPFRTSCGPYQLLFVPIVVHTSSFSYLLWFILAPFRTYCGPYQLLFIPIVVHTSSFSYLLWSMQAMNLITVYFYCFSTHGTLPQRVNEVRPRVHMQLRIDSFSFLAISLYAFSFMQQTENKALTGVCGVSCGLSEQTAILPLLLFCQ